MIQRTIPGIVLHDVEHSERNEKERRANQNEIERNLKLFFFHLKIEAS